MTRAFRAAQKLTVGAVAAVTLMACYGAPSWDQPSCVDQDGDGYCQQDDCNDQSYAVHENCDCTDNDLDGICAEDDCDDADATNVCCTDFDNDGVCEENDCDDRNPAQWENCEDFCAVAEQIEVGTVSGSTFDATDRTMTCGNGTAERIYQLPITAAIDGIEDGQLVFVTAEVQASTTHYLAVRDDCHRPDDIACNADTPQIALLSTTGELLYFIVEAADDVARGDFELTVAVQPLVCGDGLQVGPEACDDGNNEPGDGCDENCQLEVQP